MEITCPSCSTVYDIDDSQLTQRGVNFRCSQCSYVFKVQRTRDAHAGPIQIQRVAQGDVLSYDDMAAVQKSIVEGKLARNDQLSERGSPWTELGQLRSLTPFFEVLDRSNSTSSDLPAVRVGGTQALSPVSAWESKDNGDNTAGDTTASPPNSPSHNEPQQTPPKQQTPQNNSSGPHPLHPSSAPSKQRTTEEQTPAGNLSKQRRKTPQQELPPKTSPNPHPEKSTKSTSELPRQKNTDEHNTTNTYRPPSASDPIPSIDQRVNDSAKRKEGQKPFREYRPYEQQRTSNRGLVFITLLILLLLAGAASLLFFKEDLAKTALGQRIPWLTTQNSEQNTAPTQTAKNRQTDNSQTGLSPKKHALSPDTTNAATPTNSGEKSNTPIDETAKNNVAKTNTQKTKTQNQKSKDSTEDPEPSTAKSSTANSSPDPTDEKPTGDEQPSSTPKKSTEKPSDQPTPEPKPTPPATIEQMDAGQAAQVGYRALRAGSTSRAIRAFEHSLSMNPGNFDAQVQLGNAYVRAGRLQKAHSAFSAALARNPRYMPALFGIADVERALGKRTSAIKHYRAVLDIVSSGARAEQARNALRGLGVDP